MLGDAVEEQRSGVPRRARRRADGAWLLSCAEPLGPYPRRSTERLVHWAAAAPDRVFLAERRADASWRCVSYAEALRDVRALAQALLDRGLGSERPLVLLSGNGVDHALLALASQHAGIPCAPISPAYSLLATDFKLLRHALGLLSPGLVFAADGAAFERSLVEAVAADAEVVVAESAPRGRPATPLAALLATAPTPAVEAAHARIEAESVAKILFTSGSTGAPKGVINTHRMLCSNQQALAQVYPCLGEAPPVLVDWLPWHHTFGGNHNFGLVLQHGGSLYIDAGRPAPGALEITLRNLREISPTAYFNVPRGYHMLLPPLRADRALRESFFARLELLFYAAASLPPALWEELRALALRTRGRPVCMGTGLGATETAPLALAATAPGAAAGAIGVPAPGVEAKLVPLGARLELRVRGPNVTPGYWRQPELTRAAFDEEGFYRMGDAVRFAEPADPEQGLCFDGRIAEDFKLSTGTWVSPGPLRLRAIEHFAPYLLDAVISGPDRDFLAMLAVPDLEACRALCDDLAGAPAAAVLEHPRVRERLGRLLGELARQSAGSAARIERALLLEEPPSLDAGEVTDKGSLNARAILERRRALVEDLHAEVPPARVLRVPSQSIPS